MWWCYILISKDYCWWPSAVVCSMVGLLSLWHIPHFHSQFYSWECAILFKFQIIIFLAHQLHYPVNICFSIIFWWVCMCHEYLLRNSNYTRKVHKGILEFLVFLFNLNTSKSISPNQSKSSIIGLNLDVIFWLTTMSKTHFCLQSSQQINTTINSV